MSKIMDVTLRDGSYAINFQFSTVDVEIIGKELDAQGYEYIEIGHGMGLDANSPKNGISLNTDWEYLEAAQKTITEAKYGMFGIPGIAKTDSIKRAAEYGMKFIRIGTNVDVVEESKEYIRVAKECGMEVMANYMKSYAMSPKLFAEQVLKSESYGADVVYVVDSAGSMMPNDIEQYYEEIRAVSRVKLGFHGHDNLGMALANSLFAESLGFDLIDTSLQGMGRSAGNASTELFTICSMKNGINRECDYKKLLMFSQKYINPFIKGGGINAIDTICGVAGFHTSYLKAVHKAATKYEVNPLELIEEYCKCDKVNMDEKMLSVIAQGLNKDIESVLNTNFVNYFGCEQN